MDPVSDMFIRLKNGQKARHETVQMPYSKYKHEIARVLQRAGWVGEIDRKGKRVRKNLEIACLYRDEEPVIHNVALISKPSRRLYAPAKKLPRARHGGIILLSTSKGVMTTHEARKAKIGGELIAEIW